MEAIKRGCINLLKSALTGVACPVPDDFDLDAAYPVLKKHHMDALIYEGAVCCGMPTGSPLMAQLFQKYCRHLLASEGQMRQVERICAAFEANGIDYLPLKGCRMKRLYPKPELRYMGDADILIRMEQYPKVIPVMQALGFAEGKESDHELHWKHPELNLELHKRLIPTYNPDLYGYSGDGWDRAVRHEGYCWEMKAEDEWIYLFSHFTKHFRDGGIGCRHVVDLWVYLRHHPDLDGAYIRRELKQLQLLEFYENMRNVLAVWFEDAQSDEKTELMTDYIFSNGSWGNTQTRLLSRNTRNSVTTTAAENKLRYLWRVIFPDLYFMKGRYPVLRKAPWLLPVVWMYRLFHKLFAERGRIRKTKDTMDLLTTDELKARKQLLNSLGLETRNK